MDNENYPLTQQDATYLVKSEADRFLQSNLAIQVELAKKYPRSVTKSLATAEEILLLDPETARTSFYVLSFYDPKNPVIGPSIRMAEVLGNSWKNLRFGSQPGEYLEKEVTAMGYCLDIENNAAYMSMATRPIVDKLGRRFQKEQLIQNAMRAAMAIAERNAILKVIPRPYAMRIMRKAMEMIEKGQGGYAAARDKMLAAYERMGVPAKALFEWLEIGGVDDMDAEILTTLRGYYNAIQDGAASVDDILNPAPRPTATPRETVQVDPGAIKVTEPVEEPAQEEKVPEAPKDKATRKPKEDPKKAPPPKEDAPAPAKGFDREDVLERIVTLTADWTEEQLAALIERASMFEAGTPINKLRDETLATMLALLREDS